MPLDFIEIIYSFKLPEDRCELFKIVLDARDLQIVDPSIDSIPFWAKLDFHQCPNCSLSIKEHPNCPLAVHLINIVYSFEDITSHDEVYVEIITEERRISQKTTAQRAIGSLMGLVFATSGCPQAAYFKPMARFHLPLANEDETIFRTTSMYLLAQHFKRLDGETPDYELEGLTEIYKTMQIVNVSIAERLRSATETDSAINAVIFLDMFAKALPYAIKTALEEIRYLFKPYFLKPEKKST